MPCIQPVVHVSDFATVAIQVLFPALVYAAGSEKIEEFEAKNGEK